MIIDSSQGRCKIHTVFQQVKNEISVWIQKKITGKSAKDKENAKNTKSEKAINYI